MRNASSPLTSTVTILDAAGRGCTTRTLSPPPITVEANLGSIQWGMISFLISEAAFFATLIVAYLTFLGKDTVGPTPTEALSMPLVIGTTVLLLSSSVTIHFAARRLMAGDQTGFRLLWTATIVLGIAFLLGTGYEWLSSSSGITSRLVAISLAPRTILSSAFTACM